MSAMSSITFSYITSSSTSQQTVTVKDYDFFWKEVRFGERKSITGKKRNTFRGLQPNLSMNFEHDEQMITVLNNISSTLASEGTVQLVLPEGVLPLYPDSGSFQQVYTNQVVQKPSSLTLKGELYDEVTYFVTGFTCGSTTITCGQSNVFCGA